MSYNSQSVEEYRKFVVSLSRYNSGEGMNRTFLNSDEDKALAVLSELFRGANNIVRIFAGNLCEQVGTESEYIESLSDFIEKGGKVRIILNKYDDEKCRTSKLFARLAYYVSEGRDIIVKSTEVKPYYASDVERNEVHFTIADNKGYRIETDTQKRTARCNFNNPEEAKGVIAFFDDVFNSACSSVIDLVKHNI